MCVGMSRVQSFSCGQPSYATHSTQLTGQHKPVSKQQDQYGADMHASSGPDATYTPQSTMCVQTPSPATHLASVLQHLDSHCSGAHGQRPSQDDS